MARLVSVTPTVRNIANARSCLVARRLTDIALVLLVGLLFVLTSTPAAYAQFLCAGVCMNLDKGLAERLIGVRAAAEKQCQSEVETAYEKEKKHDETCNWLPPDKLPGILTDLENYRRQYLMQCAVKAIDAEISFIAALSQTLPERLMLQTTP